MAKSIATNIFVSINGTTISDHCSSLTIEDAAEEVDFTSFTPSSYREIGQGMKDASINFTVFQDYAASQVYSLLQPLYASGGTFTILVRPTSAAVSATNPQGSMTGRIYSFNPIAGAVGDAMTADITVRNAGTAGLVMGTS